MTSYPEWEMTSPSNLVISPDMVLGCQTRLDDATYRIEVIWGREDDWPYVRLCGRKEADPNFPGNWPVEMAWRTIHAKAVPRQQLYRLTTDIATNLETYIVLSTL